METKSIRLDNLHVNDLKIYQDTNGFCFGTDAVLLSWFCRRKIFNQPIDLCSGNGIIPLLFSVGNYEKIIGVEIQKDQVDLANKSIKLNNLSDRIKIINEDIRNINQKNMLNSGELKKGYFDLVSVNPPYSPQNTGAVSAGGKGIARTEQECSLEDVIMAADYLLKTSGRFCMVNKPSRLTDIMFLMRKYKIEPKVMLTVISQKGKDPSMVLIEGKKNSRAGIILEEPIYIYDDKGHYTPLLQKIYGRKD